MKLPKQVYIRIEKSGAEEWLSTSEDLNAHAEIGEKQRVGIYKLVKVVEVTTEVKLSEKV